MTFQREELRVNVEELSFVHFIRSARDVRTRWKHRREIGRRGLAQDALEVADDRVEARPARSCVTLHDSKEPLVHV